jgi:putative membrane protein
MNTLLYLADGYAPWLWLLIAVICAVIEGISFGLTTIWFALSAVLMIFVSLLHPPIYAQCFLFVLVALLLLIFTRPLALKFLHTKRIKTNADSLIGKTALVTQDITEWEKGQVKTNGAVWTAASSDGTTIPTGSECIIERIEGVTLIVRKDNATASCSSNSYEL